MKPLVLFAIGWIFWPFVLAWWFITWLLGAEESGETREPCTCTMSKEDDCPTHGDRL